MPMTPGLANRTGFNMFNTMLMLVWRCPARLKYLTDRRQPDERRMVQ